MHLPGPWGRWLALGAALGIALGWATAVGFSASVISSTGSRSMSHADHPLPGVFDPGEWRRLEVVGDRDEVTTALAARGTGHRVGGDVGDVITYEPVHEGKPVSGTLVNHRALAWVAYNATADAYDVPRLGVRGERAFVVPGVGVFDRESDRYVHRPLVVHLDPGVHGRHDGFLTKGDHNLASDQALGRGLSGIGSVELVEPGRVRGRVVDHVDTHVIERIQVGVPVGALTVSLGVLGARRAWRSGLAARLGRCSRCGCRVQGDGEFCARCGWTVDG